VLRVQVAREEQVLVVRQPKAGAVVDDLASDVAPAGVADAADGDVHLPRGQCVEELLCFGALDAVPSGSGLG